MVGCKARRSENIHSSAIIEILACSHAISLRREWLLFSRDVGPIHFDFQSHCLLPQIKVTILREEIVHTSEGLISFTGIENIPKPSSDSELEAQVAEFITSEVSGT